MDNNILISESSLLAQTEAIINKHETIAKETGALFNIFTVLNMERLEVKTHSALLYEILKPDGSHSQGKSYLKIFVEDILNIKEFNFHNVMVKRETSFDNGRVDLIIENKEFLIIIEMKIDAKDQDKQLIRYDEYAKSKGKNYKIFYLTLFGDEASEQSSVMNGETVEYERISFSLHILKFIKQCISAGKTPLLPTIRETLYQYSKLLEKITNQIDGGLMMELKELLLKENNLKLADQLAKAIPYARAELEYRFWKSFYETYVKQIEVLGFKYSEDNFFDYDIKDALEFIANERKKKSGDFVFEYLIGTINKQQLYLWIGESGNDGTIYLSIGMLEKDKAVKYDKWDKKLLEVIEGLGFTLSSNNKYRYVKTKLNFNDDSIYLLKDENLLKDVVKLIGDEVLEIANNIKASKEFNELVAI